MINRSGFPSLLLACSAFIAAVCGRWFFKPPSGSVYVGPYLNPLECRGNHSATLNHIKLVHWPLMGELLHLVRR